MNARHATFLAAAVLVCLGLPLAADAQSLVRPLWNNKDVAGEYSCRWVNPDAGGYDSEAGLDWLSDVWPKKLTVSPDGTWHAFKSSGEFRIRLNQVELKSASWAEGIFAKLVRDKHSTTAIAVYLPGWCGSDLDVHLAFICNKAGEKLSDEAMLTKSLPDPHKYPQFTSFSFGR
ncbi:MAG: hypothetical protein L0Z53_13690 [Acidobacteriales bacterium]|nr:hypothetical protein [Terriglobales bacterium]